MTESGCKKVFAAALFFVDLHKLKGENLEDLPIDSRNL